jgi:hypothetical protein
MAAILDKIKGMFNKKPTAGAEGGSTMDTIKEKAGEVKDKVDELVDKVGEKVPAPVKNAYEKVSDKIEDIIPGGDKPSASDAEAVVDSVADDVASTIQDISDRPPAEG